MDLYLAVENGTLEEVKIALKTHSEWLDVMDPTCRNITPLHIAAFRCDPAIMAALIIAGSRSFESELGDCYSEGEYSSYYDGYRSPPEYYSSFESSPDRPVNPVLARLYQMLNISSEEEEDDSVEQPSLKKKIATFSRSKGWIPLNLAIVSINASREDQIATIQLLLDAAPNTLFRIDLEDRTPLYYGIHHFCNHPVLPTDQRSAPFEGLMRWVESNPTPSFFTTLTEGSFLPWYELAMAGSKEMIDRWMVIWLKCRQLWPLETADATRKEEFIRLEFDAPSLFGERPLMAAFGTNKIPVIETILKWANRISPEYPILDQTHSSRDNTLLHTVVESGTRDMIWLLIKRGWTNIDPINDRGETPFYMAVKMWRKRGSLVKALLQLGSQGLFQYSLEELVGDSKQEALRILFALGMEEEIDPSSNHPTGLEVPSLTPDEIRKIRFRTYFKPSLTQRLVWYLI